AARLRVEDRPAEVHGEADPEHEREIALLFGSDELPVAELARLPVERLRAALDDLVLARDTAAAVGDESGEPGPHAGPLAVGVVVDAGAALNAEALRVAELPHERRRLDRTRGRDRVEHAGGAVEA